MNKMLQILLFAGVLSFQHVCQVIADPPQLPRPYPYSFKKITDIFKDPIKIINGKRVLTHLFEKDTIQFEDYVIEGDFCSKGCSVKISSTDKDDNFIISSNLIRIGGFLPVTKNHLSDQKEMHQRHYIFKVSNNNFFQIITSAYFNSNGIFTGKEFIIHSVFITSNQLRFP